MGLSDSLCPFLQICWHSPFIEVHTRKKRLPYVRQSLCKSFMDLWYKGLSNATNPFIHSFTTKYIQGSYQALCRDAEMDEHSSCPWRTYNDGRGRCVRRDKHRNISDTRQASRQTDRYAFLFWDALKLMLEEIKESFPEEVALEFGHELVTWGWTFQVQLALGIRFNCSASEWIPFLHQWVLRFPAPMKKLKFPDTFSVSTAAKIWACDLEFTNQISPPQILGRKLELDSIH